ncbi:PrkA family serine protein kinase [Anaeromyxobacter oryzae]|uniref:Serine protein kinase n=1 Tax=Anaeromyxobacter oryzae TaxID=2918170 RepID=A0ABN6MZN7_9BACT|nr:serine protein kinase PrkA [Anaeromyxobacter oryzae]BDG06401.1 serine protein kinase [Anaeromyxobacter oryzae]
MDAQRWLSSVGTGVKGAFVENRSLLSFEEYLQVFLDAPRRQARSSAQYVHDVLEHFGAEDRETPVGTVRRWRLFDLPWDPEGRVQRIAGQEEVQAALHRDVGTFVRSGRVNKLVLLHGPNGSAKSSIVAALVRGMEAYSRLPAGALYRFHWVFPSERRLRSGGLGFGPRDGEGALGALGSFAHLDGDALDARLSCPMKDHPLLLVPREERRKLLEERCRPSARDGAGEGDFVLSDYLVEGELCQYCRQVHDALLGAYRGDWLKVLRHVQVERFYVSSRYQQAAVTVEPQLSVDAGFRQVTVDRSAGALPPALHAVTLLEPFGPLVSANRGIIEYSDLLKREPQLFKYLLGTSETGRVSLDHFLLQLDVVLVASANEKQLSAFKESADFASFKGRLALVRVPYVRRHSVEREIYDRQITAAAVGKHVAPHATSVAALWAVLTRLKRPIPDRYEGELRDLVEDLAPLEKLRLYDSGEAPDRLSLAQAKVLRKHAVDLYHESDVYPNYEGRSGASAREIKTVLLNAAQAPGARCLTPRAVLDELDALCRDKTLHDFLQSEVVDGYHDHEEFVRVAEAEYLETLDEEIRDSMGMVSEGQYRELFERYVTLVSHWVKGEKVRNRVTGEYAPPEEVRMAEFERIVMPVGDDRGNFRRGLIAAVGAFRLDHPDSAEIDYVAIFPDLFRRLRDHYYEERKRQLQRSKENVLRYLSDERSSLDEKARRQVEATLATMRERYGYCEHCAQDAILFLMRRRYEDAR